MTELENRFFSNEEPLDPDWKLDYVIFNNIHLFFCALAEDNGTEVGRQRFRQGLDSYFKAVLKDAKYIALLDEPKPQQDLN